MEDLLFMEFEGKCLSIFYSSKNVPSSYGLGILAINNSEIVFDVENSRFGFTKQYIDPVESES